VLASYVAPAGDAKTSPAKDVSRWTKTDRSGNFHFEGVTAGTKVTLVPIRDGFPVAAPVQAVAGENKTSQIKEEQGDLVALTGRVVGPDHKPIAGAQVVIQVEHSPDPQHIFRATLDADGTFQTPAQFPKQLKYRLTARSILKDVASTDWLCPAAGRSSTTLVHFPDLVADRSQLGLEKRIPGEQVAALVDGRPILAKELLERAYPEPLSPEGLSLLTAAKAIKSGRVTESEYRALQETAIKKYAGDYARTRMLARALQATLDEGQKVQIERAIDKMFDEYVEKLKQDLHTSSRAGVDSKLREQGTSLAGLKIEFRHRLLADEYSRQAGGHVSEIAWQRLFEYYQAHRQAYAVPEKVSWQLLEVEFDNPADRLPKAGEQAVKKETDPSARAVAADYSQPAADQLHLGSSILDGASDRLATQRTATDFTPDNSAIASKEKHDEFDAVKYFAELNSRVSREKARHTMDEALTQLHKGVSFADVAKKFSTGPHADQGGWQARVRPNSLADEKTAAALRQLPEGAPSGVIETDHSFRIIRVASRTPAGRKPFEEVEESIREHFRDDLQAKALEELYSRTSIESPYIDDVSSISHPVAACRSPNAQQDAFAQ
jgi:parvulin-like peptidyl-prolyl isomerase